MPRFRFLFLVLFVGASSLARAQSIEEFLLPVAAGPVPLATLEEIRYRSTNTDERGFNRTVEAPLTPPTLTVYRPAADQDRGLAVVICPGGGYQRLLIDTEGHAVARRLQSHGMTGAVLKYRVPQPAVADQSLPLSQQDALAALRFLREKAAKDQRPFRLVGIMGFSAGGHLAASTAVFGKRGDQSRPDFVALIYPVVSMIPPYVHVGSQRALLGDAPPRERQLEFSLERHVGPGHPPHLLLHAKDDQPVPPQNSQMLAEALERAGVPVQLHLFETGGHGFRSEESRQWPEFLLSWLRGL